MQEDVTQKTIALTHKGAEITAEQLKKLLEAAYRKLKEQRAPPKRGKMSVKKLARQDAGLTNIEITDNNIKSFERVARKYGVDFALKKDVTESPPRWLVFFKARDTDALAAAFKEYSAKSVKRGTNKPSLLGRLDQCKKQVKNATIDKIKNKDRGGHEL